MVLLRSLCFAVVALLLVPAVAAQDKKWEKEDGPGDMVLTVGGQVTPVPAPPIRHVNYGDLTHLTIDDPHEGYIEFRLRNQAGYVASPGTLGGVEEIIQHILFQPPNAQGWAGLAVYSSVPGTSPASNPVTSRVNFCTDTDPARLSCFGESTLPFSVEEKELVIKLPKKALTADGAPKGGRAAIVFPAALFAGDQLTRVHVRSYSTVPIVLFGSGTASGGRTVTFFDRLPNDGDGPAYVLKHGASPPDLEVRVLRAGLVAGEETLVPISIANKAPSKRLLNLTAEVLSGGEGWKYGLTPALTLGSGKSANATLRITAPRGGTGDANRATFRIAAAIMNEPGRRSLVEASFVAGPALDAGRSTFYLHRGQTETVLAPTAYGESDAFLSRYETDPEARDDAGIHAGKRVGSGVSGFRFPFDFFDGGSLRDAIPNAASLRKAEPIKGHFEFDVPIDLQGRATFTLTAGDGKVLLASGQKDIAFKAGKNVVDIDAAIAGPFERLGPSDLLSGDVLLASDPLVGFAGYFVSFADDFYMLPKTSHFTIPVDREAEVIIRPDLPRVSLAAAEDTEAFVNPGRKTVFEVDLLNDDTKAQNLVLLVDNKTLEWDVQILPGTDLRLRANESARLGIIVHAPADAKEGTKLQLSIAARLRETNELLSLLRLSALATSGVEIDNETFEVAAEDARKLATPDGRSPFPMFVAVGAVLAVAALLRRRLFS
ncbi:MAG: hypothetical protein HYT80_02100 [Euryarchaeota archaeon]|nr:hypothetical protein [Euryarchaeota archaeon]